VFTSSRHHIIFSLLPSRFSSMELMSMLMLMSDVRPWVKKVALHDNVTMANCIVSVNKPPSVLAAWQALYRHSKSPHWLSLTMVSGAFIINYYYSWAYSSDTATAQYYFNLDEIMIASSPVFHRGKDDHERRACSNRRTNRITAISRRQSTIASGYRRYQCGRQQQVRVRRLIRLAEW